MRSIALRWSGPYTFKWLLTSAKSRERFCSPGIYLWIEAFHGSPQQGLVAEVGKATNLRKRLLEHYQGFLSCRYDVPKWVRPVGEWRCLLDESEVATTLFDKRRLLELTSMSFEYANSFRLFVAPSRADLAVVERNLIWDLQPTGNVHGKKSEPPERVRIVHYGATWATAKALKSARHRPVLG
jgi:hypothetical protein